MPLRRALDIFYFSFYFSSTAKSAGGFVCPSRKVAGSKPKTKKKTGPARRHRGDKAETASISAAAAPSYRVARHVEAFVKMTAYHRINHIV